MARLGVIRSDVGSLFVADLEPVSQWAPSVEPLGQERYIARPNPTVATNSTKSVATILAADTAGLTEVQIAATAPLIIARGLPLGGAINVTKTNLDFDYSGIDANAFNFAGTPMNAGTATALMAELAPSFVETGVFMLSFDHGTVAGMKSASFTYKGSAGAAIGVVQDDGVTAYTLP